MAEKSKKAQLEEKINKIRDELEYAQKSLGWFAMGDAVRLQEKFLQMQTFKSNCLNLAKETMLFLRFNTCPNYPDAYNRLILAIEDFDKLKNS
jgi:hypothetical protein